MQSKRKVYITILITTIVVVAIVVMVLLHRLYRGQAEQSAPPAPVQDPDEYLVRAKEILESVDENEVNNSLDNTWAYAWAWQEYYKATGDQEALAKYMELLDRAESLQTQGQKNREYNCVLAADMMANKYLSEQAQARAKAICENASYEVYQSEEYQDMQQRIRYGRENFSDGHILFPYSTEYFMTEYGQQFYDLISASAANGNVVTPKTDAETVMMYMYPELHMSLDRLAYVQSVYDADSDEEEFIAEVAQADYYYLNNELYRWYLEYLWNRETDDETEGEVSLSNTTKCLFYENLATLINANMPLYVEKSIGNYVLLQVPHYTDSSSCRLAAYNMDKTNLDKQQLLEDYEYLIADGVYEKIMTAGLLSK